MFSSYKITTKTKNVFEGELKENSIINVDAICDVYYKLNYRGKINDELLFSLC